MKTLKTRLIAAAAAATIALVPFTASANWATPSLLDLDASIANIAGNVTKILALTTLQADNIKIVNVEDLADASDVADISDTLNDLTVQLQLITLKNALNHVNVIENSNILTFADFLNANDVDVSDVIALDVFRGGKVLVFSCDSCK